MAERVRTEVDWSVDYDGELYEAVLTKITRRYPVSARGVERRHGPEVTTESLRIPRWTFPDLVATLTETMLVHATEAEYVDDQGRSTDGSSGHRRPCECPHHNKERNLDAGEGP